MADRGRRPTEDGWGPTVDGGRRGRVRPGRALVLLVVLALLVPVTAGLWASQQVPTEEVEGLASPGRPLHVLVTGSDSRQGLTREEQNELTLGRDEDGSERTDTIFIMTIEGSRVALLAFPRDLWVRRCDGSTGRINVAVQLGTSCLVDTVREVSGIEVAHHVRVTFGGFRDVVDAVGGVELCLEEPIADRDAGIDLPAGCQQLDGQDALGFVRVRKIDDDLQRIRRQQQFLRALAGEVAAPSTVLNPLRFVRLSREIGGALTVDDGLGPVSQIRLARGARGLAAGRAATHTIPVTDGTVGGASVLFVDEVEAGPLFRSFADGSVLDETEGQASVDPAEVPVRVLNGAEVSGLAGQVADVLGGRGYPVTEIGNTDPRDTTLVRHPASQAAGAQAVADDLPGRVRTEQADIDVVTVLLGRDAAAR